MTTQQINQVVGEVVKMDAVKVGSVTSDFIRVKIEEKSGVIAGSEEENKILNIILHKLWWIQEEARLKSCGVVLTRIVN